LQPEDEEALIPTWVATRSDLDTAEQDNIAKAAAWVRSRRWKADDISQAWLKNLHLRMFGEVWKWAGSYRGSDTNIGVSWAGISLSVEDLVRDLRVWTQGSIPSDELAVTFHHRLVSIHPFPNGNGRHSRLAADTLVEALGEKRFSWGSGAELGARSVVRTQYLDALRSADAGNLGPLILFARQ